MGMRFGRRDRALPGARRHRSPDHLQRSRSCRNEGRCPMPGQVAQGGARGDDPYPAHGRSGLQRHREVDMNDLMTNSRDWEPGGFIKASAWEGRTVSPRQWAVADRIPLLNVTMLSGEGAMGKSILMTQLAVATVLGCDWLGVTPKKGPVIALSAEEDEDEFHRRLIPIVAHYDARLSDLEQLNALCLAGQDATLAAPDPDGIIRPTPLFERLKSFAVQTRPRLITIDNAADVFAGKENDRTQVRQFI